MSHGPEYAEGYALGYRSGRRNALNERGEPGDPDSEMAMATLQHARDWLREHHSDEPNFMQHPENRLAYFTNGYIFGVHDGEVRTTRELGDEAEPGDAWHSAAGGASVALADLALWVASTEQGVEAFER